jgi:hypothetical protein
MEKTVDVYYAEMCCEDQDWDLLGRFAQVSGTIQESMMIVEAVRR